MIQYNNRDDTIIITIKNPIVWIFEKVMDFIDWYNAKSDKIIRSIVKYLDE